jgi:hypothetical protein
VSGAMRHAAAAARGLGLVLLVLGGLALLAVVAAGMLLDWLLTGGNRAG